MQSGTQRDRNGPHHGVSVVVCCHNSVSRIEPTLRHLHQQEVAERTRWEVIVVDNASTDGTAEVAERCWRSFGSVGASAVELKIVHEEEPGLTNARLRGYRASRYAILVFCDDDNWLSPTYVQTALRTMGLDERIGVVGGCGSPVFEGEEPSWFADVASSYAVGQQGDGTRGPLTHKRTVYGAGMVVRREGLEILDQTGYRFLQSDRTGAALSTGGDAELCYLFRMMGYDLWYDNELAFRHFMPGSRLTPERHLRMLYECGRAKLIALLYRWYLDDRPRFEARFAWGRELLEIAKQFVLYRMKEAMTSRDSEDSFQLRIMVRWYGGMLRAFLGGRSTFYQAQRYLKELGPRLSAKPPKRGTR